MICSHDLSSNKISRDLVIALVLGARGELSAWNCLGIKMHASKEGLCLLSPDIHLYSNTNDLFSVHH